jgi:hypothetical protein
VAGYGSGCNSSSILFVTDIALRICVFPDSFAFLSCSRSCLCFIATRFVFPEDYQLPGAPGCSQSLGADRQEEAAVVLEAIDTSTCSCKLHLSPNSIACVSCYVFSDRLWIGIGFEALELHRVPAVICTKYAIAITVPRLSPRAPWSSITLVLYGNLWRNIAQCSCFGHTLMFCNR